MNNFTLNWNVQTGAFYTGLPHIQCVRGVLVL